jgi:hypothetical protein
VTALVSAGITREADQLANGLIDLKFVRRCVVILAGAPAAWTPVTRVSGAAWRIQTPMPFTSAALPTGT